MLHWRRCGCAFVGQLSSGAGRRSSRPCPVQDESSDNANDRTSVTTSPYISPACIHARTVSTLQGGTMYPCI